MCSLKGVCVCVCVWFERGVEGEGRGTRPGLHASPHGLHGTSIACAVLSRVRGVVARLDPAE